MATATSSAKLRSRGNQLFQSATDGLAPCLQRARLTQAVDVYMQAAQTSATQDEYVSAMKNAGAASRRLFLASCSPNEQLEYLTQAVAHYGAAVTHGAAVKDQAWMATCFDATLSLFDDLMSMLDNDGNPAFVMGCLSRCSKSLRDCSSTLQSTWHLQHAQYLFNWYIKESQMLLCSGLQPEEVDYRRWVSLIAEARIPAERVMQCREAPQDVVADGRVLLQDLQLAEYTLESVKVRQQADAMLAHEMHVEMAPRMDMVWGAVDRYREAARLTRELDLENEAIALSRLGRVYSKVLKVQGKAGDCFRKVLELAEALKPRVVYNQDWCKEAREVLRSYQEAAERREQAAADERRAPYLEALAAELEALKAAFNDSKVVFVKHLYSHHPPRNPAHTLLEEPTLDNVKSLLRKAVMHYHPDKQQQAQQQQEQQQQRDQSGQEGDADGEQVDMKWVVLCEEITKYINLSWETFKG